MQSGSGAVDAGVEGYWTAGLGGAIMCITLIDFMHKDLSKGQRIPKVGRACHTRSVPLHDYLRS